MYRVALLAVTLTAGFLSGGVVQAEDFWDRVHLDFRRMNCWPEPFVHADRSLVRGPLAAMSTSGWRLQNTLSDHLFDPQDQSLTRAGELKVRWILTQAPPHRRTVYVLRASGSEATHARVAAVEQYVNRALELPSQPEVFVSETAPTGGAGDYLDQVDRQLKASVPPPRLPSRGNTADF